MSLYDHRSIEAKWQKVWDEQGIYKTSTDRTRPKYYVLDMFPYPSGAGLHVGHPKGYVATDIVARARRMMGYNVLRVMGWDSFGLPSERQAERENTHPALITARNIQTFKDQLSRLGLSYDWDRELATSDAKYYKWTQWIFLQLYNAGLAYRSETPVNWCPALGTVLANEEVKDGVYVETGDPVERRSMTQWMFRITAYADKLLAGLEDLDWPDGIKKQQRDWIGRSVGAEVSFAVAGTGHSFKVFTTRPDTLFGCSYAVLAPEHELVEAITTPERAAAVHAYREQVKRRSDRDRMAQAADAPKTGVWTGAYAVNPVTGEEVQLWIADYVLAGYGTGAVFACPAHDERDHAFARTHGLAIREVVAGGDVQTAAYTGDGPHVNSDFLNGLDIETAKKVVTSWLEERGSGREMVQYRLRDWLFARQRSWGEPFPILERPDGTIVTVPEAELPVVLPELAEFKGTGDGRPPLARAEEWVKAKDPVTGLPVQRETSTMPQWAGSCWYYLRFISPDRDDVAWDRGDESYWMPVDLYVGGAEHAVLHLLYSRFWHQVLFDLKLVSTPEPFKRLYNQGMILANSYRDARGKYYYPTQVEEKSGTWFVKGTDTPVERKLEKMSKSRYNVENPDDMCDQYGADALRLYELFMGPLEDTAIWETTGVAGTRRFLERAWRLVVDPETGERPSKLVDHAVDDRPLERSLHSMLKKVSEAVDSLKFNTAIAEMMMFVNEATRASAVPVEAVDAFVRVLAPFAPHVSEELWARLGHSESVTGASWPSFDESKIKADTLTLSVQVNGKLRATIEVAPDISAEDAIATAKRSESVQKFVAGGTIRREIYVPGRLVNLVVN